MATKERAKLSEVMCSVCGKPISGDVQYIVMQAPSCSFCWENFYDVRYIPASIKHKFQETLKKAAGEVAKLDKRLELGPENVTKLEIKGFDIIL